MLNSQTKILREQDDAKSIQNKIALLGSPLVFTNGCFDILHLGHVTYLEQARNMGAALVVGVNSDASVKRQGKGDDRPINCLEDRMAVLASLAAVDAVIDFDDDTPLDLIKLITPDVLVKGGDWAVDQIVGADWVIENGGTVHSIEFQHDRSTTNIVQKIKCL